MTAFLQRHILHLILLLAGCAALLDSPPAFIDGLPGPGIWPRAAGLTLIVCTVLLPAPPKARAVDARGRRAAWGLTAAGIVFIILTPLSGWLPASAASALLASLKAGCSRREAVLLTTLLCTGLWFLVEHLLNWPLPDGLLGELFSGGR